MYKLDVDEARKRRYATVFLLAAATGLRCGELFALRVNDIDFKAGTIRVDESADQRTYKIGPCKNAAAYRTVLLADAEGREALSALKRFLKGPHLSNSLVFQSRRGSPRRETNVLPEFLHPVLKALGLQKAGMHTFRHGCNRRWELAGMNAAVLRQQMCAAIHSIPNSLSARPKCERAFSPRNCSPSGAAADVRKMLFLSV